MPTATLPGPEDCNCFAVRSAARHVSQFYDQFLAPIGLRTTQFSILAKLKRRGPLTINALANGIATDAIGNLFLAYDLTKPIIVAPAMNVQMLAHPATKSSIEKLKSWGVQVLETDSGLLACGDVGEGRLLEPDRIFAAIQERLARFV